MLAISDEGVDLSIGDPKVRALLVGTSEALGIDPLGGSPTAFDLTPRWHGRRSWPSTRRGSEAETTGRAIVWGAGLEQMLERGALGPSLEEEGRRWNQHRRQSSARERMRKNTSRSTNT
jgi:hypothetical protein